MERATSALISAITTATCIYEPLGDAGLEGYSCGLSYRYERREPVGKKPYYRVWPALDSDEYKTCGTTAFNRYFRTNA